MATWRAVIVSAFSSALMVLPAAAQQPPPPSAENGHKLAQRWCTACHIIDDAGTGVDAAPPFEVIARRDGRDAAYLKAWIADPHWPMPRFDLSTSQIEDLAAHILSRK